MNQFKMLLTVVVLAFSIHSIAQAGLMSETIAVKISSPKDSPIVLNGSLKCSEWNEGNQTRQEGSGVVKATNQSNKNVVAIVVRIHYSCFHGAPAQDIYAHDFYFKTAAFPPGGTIDIPLMINDGITKVGVQKITSTAEAAFTYAQFEDGSEFGSDPAGEDLKGRRPDVIEFLNRLVSAAASPSEFASVLQSGKDIDKSTFAIAQHIEMLNKDSGMESAVANAKDRLNIAASRKF